MRTNTAAPAADTTAAEEVVHAARLTQIEATITQAGQLMGLLRELRSAEEQMEGNRAALAQFDAFYAKAGLSAMNSYEMALKELAHKEGHIASLKHERNSSSDAAVRTLCGMGWSHEGGEQWRPPFGKSPLFAKLIPTVDDIVQGIKRRIDTIEAKGDGAKALSELSDAINEALTIAGADPLTEPAERVGGPIVMGIELSAEAMAELAAEAGRVDGVFVVAKAGAGITFVDHKLYTEKASEVRTKLSGIYDRAKDTPSGYVSISFGTLCDVMNLLDPTPQPATAPVDAAEDKGVAIMKEAADAIREMSGMPGSAIEPRPDLLDASPAPTKHYTFDEFVEYGREWSKANNHALTGGMPWSFSFHGFAVSHEHDDLYLIASTPGVTHHFNHGDEISVVPGLGFQIHSAAPRTLGHPTGNRRVFVPGDIVRHKATLAILYEVTQHDIETCLVHARRVDTPRGVLDVGIIVPPWHLEIAPMAEAAKAVGLLNRAEDKAIGSTRNMHFEGKFSDETLNERAARLLMAGWTAARITETAGYLNVNGDVVYPKVEAPQPQAAHDLIEPTIGRRVWFRPDPRMGASNFHVLGDQPMDAGIVFVWGDRLVNLDVTDHQGTHHPFTSVTLVQPGDPEPTDGHYCEWMPYQKGQASKGSK